jgi:hypothetical protein
MSASVSKLATGMVVDVPTSSATAVDAPSPASTQPSRETTSTGLVSRAPMGSPQSGSTV